MKYFLTTLIMMFALTIVSYASDISFADIQKRVTNRNEITKAILTIDRGKRFSLTVKENKAVVKIWKHMKVVDPNMETYTFTVTPEIRQEYIRLELQKDLNKLIEKCSLAERKYRVANYKNRRIFFGMPYKEALKILGTEFKDSGPRTLEGSYGLVSDKYIIEFRSSKLYDIKKR